MKRTIYNAITAFGVLASISSSTWFSLFTSNVYEYMDLTRRILIICFGIILLASAMTLLSIRLGRLVAPSCSAVYGLLFWLKELIRHWNYYRTLFDSGYIDYSIFKMLRELAVFGVSVWAAICIIAALTCIHKCYVKRRRTQ